MVNKASIVYNLVEARRSHKKKHVASDTSTPHTGILSLGYSLATLYTGFQDTLTQIDELKPFQDVRPLMQDV